MGTSLGLSNAQQGQAARAEDTIGVLPVFVVTNRVLRLWEQVLLSLHVRNEHVIVVGTVGCGKSEAVRALAGLLGRPLEHVYEPCSRFVPLPIGAVRRVTDCPVVACRYLTPETDAAQLVGQLVPNQASGDRFVFRDGPVTKAVRTSGAWVLLDDVNTADACVLERLNPVLEQPPVWTVTENAEDQPLPIPETFRVMATMSPPTGTPATAHAVGAELSPALANRFTNVVMESPEPNPINEFRALAKVLVPEACVDFASKACTELWRYTQNSMALNLSRCASSIRNSACLITHCDTLGSHLHACVCVVCVCPDS